MNFLVRPALNKFYLSIIDNYCFLKKNGIQLSDIKLQIIKKVLKLDNQKFINEAGNAIIKDLDLIDLILFFLWFNTSLGSKFMEIPKVRMSSNDYSKERQYIMQLLFRKGNWWLLKNELKNNFEVPFNSFIDFGENLVNTYNLI
jgi:hypothetical protein